MCVAATGSFHDFLNEGHFFAIPKFYSPSDVAIEFSFFGLCLGFLLAFLETQKSKRA